MQVTSKRHSAYSKLGAIIAGALLLFLVVAKIFHIWPFSPTTSVDPNATITKTVHTSPKNNNPTDKQTQDSSTDKTSQQIPVNPSYTATITELKENNNSINFTATIPNAPSTGTCVVTFSNPNDRPVTKQFNPTSTNGSATCGPTTISTYEFSYLGTWQVAFHYYIGDQQVTAQGQITIE